MNEELKFETYLFIDKKKLVICVIKKKTFEVIFKEEKLLGESGVILRLVQRHFQKLYPYPICGISTGG